MHLPELGKRVLETCAPVNLLSVKLSGGKTKHTELDPANAIHSDALQGSVPTAVIDF